MYIPETKIKTPANLSITEKMVCTCQAETKLAFCNNSEGKESSMRLDVTQQVAAADTIFADLQGYAPDFVFWHASCNVDSAIADLIFVGRRFGATCL
jgi:hypothetical protein